jgi:hypothetical protein
LSIFNFESHITKIKWLIRAKSINVYFYAMGNDFVTAYRRVVRNNDFSPSNLNELRTLWSQLNFQEQREVWKQLNGVMDQRVINAIS